MNLRRAALALPLAVVLWAHPAAGEGVGTPSPPQWRSRPDTTSWATPNTGPSTAISIAGLTLCTNSPVTTIVSRCAGVFANPRPELKPGSSGSGLLLKLRPGIYESQPYTMIVIVPRAQPDDRSIAKGQGLPEPTMPTQRPELRLTPRQPQ